MTMKRPVYPHPKTLKVFCWIVAFLILFARFFRRAGHFNYITMMWIAYALFTVITIYISWYSFKQDCTKMFWLSIGSWIFAGLLLLFLQYYFQSFLA